MKIRIVILSLVIYMLVSSLLAETLIASDKKSGIKKAESPVWAKIILDEEFSNKGKVWQLAQAVYADLASMNIPNGKPDDLFSIGAGFVEKAGGKSIESFRKKYGAGTIEKTDKGVTYYCFGPLSLGFKPGDKSFTWLRAPNRMFREGFIEVAKKTSK